MSVFVTIKKKVSQSGLGPHGPHDTTAGLIRDDPAFDNGSSYLHFIAICSNEAKYLPTQK
jgi:hypothetical protein